MRGSTRQLPGGRREIRGLIVLTKAGCLLKKLSRARAEARFVDSDRMLFQNPAERFRDISIAVAFLQGLQDSHKLGFPLVRQWMLGSEDCLGTVESRRVKTAPPSKLGLSLVAGLHGVVKKERALGAVGQHKTKTVILPERSATQAADRLLAEQLDRLA